jgi:hypothetical protein
MKRWDERPIEIRNLFNPAFCGLVLSRSFSGYEEEDPSGMPFSLSLLVLPLSLQKHSRKILAEHNRAYFLKTVAGHPELLVDFAQRAQALFPFALEALGLLMHLRTFNVTNDGRFQTIPGRVRKSFGGSLESIECQRVAAYLGKQFARIGDRSTIYTTLGVRP